MDLLRTARLRLATANITHTHLLLQARPQYFRQQCLREIHTPPTRPRQSLLRRFRLSRPNSTNNHPSPSPKASPNPTPHLGSPAPTTLSARLKALSREYGWTALGVYLGLSALDFPFCYLAVRLLGTDRIGAAEHAIVTAFWSAVGAVMPSMKPSEHDGQAREGGDMAKIKKEGDASIWTQLALAYAVHKSLIFFRVPLTAAILPRVVKTLRGWGWNIGKKKVVPK